MTPPMSPDPMGEMREAVEPSEGQLAALEREALRALVEFGQARVAEDIGKRAYFEQRGRHALVAILKAIRSPRYAELVAERSDWFKEGWRLAVVPLSASRGLGVEGFRPESPCGVRAPHDTGPQVQHDDGKE